MEMLQVFRVVSALSSMQRYSQTFLNKRESVLEHTGFVGLFCCLIAQEILADGENVDLGVLFCKAVLHDVDEIITGDIPRPTKYFDEATRKNFERIELAGMESLMQQLHLGPPVFLSWRESKHGAEGEIVAIADIAAVVYKGWEEVYLLGNRSFLHNIEGLPNTLRLILDRTKSGYLQKITRDLMLIVESLLEDKEELSWKLKF